MELNLKEKIQISDVHNGSLQSIVLIYTDIFKGKTRINQEEYNLETIIKFTHKHNLSKELSIKEISKAIIKQWNNTLLKGERKRTFKAVYEKYASVVIYKKL